jgi:DNA polymerase elongation subunit (family B)
MDAQDLIQEVKFGNMKYYNFYNTDLEPNTYFTVKHYLENQEDNIDMYDQKIHALYLDIEVFKDDPDAQFDFNKSDFPISAITYYSTIEKTFKLYFLIHPVLKGKFNPDPEWYKKELLGKKYITNEEKVEVSVFQNELELIEKCWADIRKTDPMVLSGFNSDGFDYPYIYRRLMGFYNGDENTVHEILSQFKSVKWDGKLVKVPEFGNADLQYFYKPRAEGGLNYGKTLPSYSLDSISTHELKLQKFEYKGTNKNLDDFYINDPSNYALYNIVDVALLVRLNEKLKHIELHNLLRRMQKAPYTRSLVGNSALFDAYILDKLNSQDKKVRHGMSTENSLILKVEDFKGISCPKEKKGIVKPIDITAQEFREITMKFDGAYVKESKSKIIVNGLIMDLDAAKLYPSMIEQSNIGFDTYKGRTISPLTYKIIEHLGKTLGQQSLDIRLSNKIWPLVKTFIDNSNITPKSQAKIQWYYLANKFLKTLYDSGLGLKQILKPTNDKESILLIKYLIPFLDLWNNIHPDRKEYNHFVYDHIFDTPQNVKENYPFIYVIKDINSPAMYIEKLSIENTLKFVNQYSLTVTGCCFTKHEDYLGLFTETLKNLATMRKEYKGKMFKFPKGSEEFDFWNSRQLSVKICSNSIYGIMGLKTFRYSDHNLAQSVTTQGRLAIKLAQHLTEEHLKEKYNEPNSN